MYTKIVDAIAVDRMFFYNCPDFVFLNTKSWILDFFN